MKALVFFLGLAVAGYCVMQRPAVQRAKARMAKTAAARSTAQPGQPTTGTLVIEYSDPAELLVKLQRVPSGQNIDVRSIGPNERVISTNIPCSDTAARAAFIEKMNREAEWLSRNIQAEMDRIYRIR
jgi:hypothetical protein